MAKDHWNPRRETMVKLSFKTYALRGLLFFIGKGVSGFFRFFNVVLDLRCVFLLGLLRY